MATKKNPTKDTKTNTFSGTTEAEYAKVESVADKLDRVIELLEHIAVNASNIPFQGIDCSRMFRG